MHVIWEDIAMLYRSLRHNFDGTYGKVYPGLDPDSFFEELEIEPDREKIDYYILLDELFKTEGYLYDIQ